MRITIKKLVRLYKFTYFKWIIRLFVVGILASIIVLITFTKEKPFCDKCNVILVSLDTLSALHLPCYGYERNTAPNLCSYADKNLLFLNSYSQSPTTLNSHMSIFTSLYPHTHQITKIYENSLDEKNLTLAQIFRSNGYKTIYGGPIKDAHLPLERGVGRGFDIIENRTNKNKKDTDNWNVPLNRLLQNNKNNKPTFLFLHTYAVHSPYLTGHQKQHLFTNLPEYSDIPLDSKEYQMISPEFLKYVADKIEDNTFYYNLSLSRKSDLEIASKLKQNLASSEKVKLFKMLPNELRIFLLSSWAMSKVDLKDQNQIAYIKALYDEQIYNLDIQLSKLFAFLADTNLSKNTILIITSDHGEEFVEHGYIMHGNNLFSTSTRVPLIMHIPQVEPSKINELVQGIDIYPTALSLTGLKPQSQIEGLDLTGIIRGDKNAFQNPYLLSEYLGMEGIQVNNWRFYYSTKLQRSIGLYDLNVDPVEQNNLILQRNEKANEILKLIKN